MAQCPQLIKRRVCAVRQPDKAVEHPRPQLLVCFRAASAGKGLRIEHTGHALRRAGHDCDRLRTRVSARAHALGLRWDIRVQRSRRNDAVLGRHKPDKPRRRADRAAFYRQIVLPRSIQPEPQRASCLRPRLSRDPSQRRVVVQILSRRRLGKALVDRPVAVGVERLYLRCRRVQPDGKVCRVVHRKSGFLFKNRQHLPVKLVYFLQIRTSNACFSS